MFPFQRNANKDRISGDPGLRLAGDDARADQHPSDRGEEHAGPGGPQPPQLQSAGHPGGAEAEQQDQWEQFVKI